MRCGVLTLAGMLTCSACQSFDSSAQMYDERRSKEGVIIAPYSPEHAARHGPGFAVTMPRDEARRLRAPDGEEFKEMLEKRLAEERMRGNTYCPHGYDIVKAISYKHWYTEIWADCKRK